MTEKQSQYIIQDDKWVATYENEYYMMKTQSYPKECAGKEKCNG